MKPFLLREAVAACGGRLIGDTVALDREVTFVTSDSRTAGPGGLFVALKGEHVDGHSFMAECLKKGCVACVSEREPQSDEEIPCIVVESTQRALGSIAAWHRSRFDIPVIGITGSVGKTTTKEMIASVLSQRFNTHRTEKNFNNELGVPWTLLRLEDQNQVSVVEMGINQFGEMRRLTRMVRPDIAVFTLIGEAHLEYLGDLQGVLRAKGEIVEGMSPDGLLILNGDDPLLRAFNPGLRRLTYGKSPATDVCAEDIQIDGVNGASLTIRHPGGSFAARINGYGTPLIYAALAAAAVGLTVGLTGEEIAAGIADYQTVGDRARVIKLDHLTVVSDCYNANPNSVRAAIDSLSLMAGRRVAILGDMLELGERTRELHREIGEYAVRGGVNLVVGCGPLGASIAEGARDAGGKATAYPDREALISHLPEFLRSGDVVLVKASHGMALERVVEAICKNGEWGMGNGE